MISRNRTFTFSGRTFSSLFHFLILIDTYFNWINSRYPIPCGVLIYWLHICNLQTHCQCHQENWAPSSRFCFFFRAVRIGFGQFYSQIWMKYVWKLRWHSCHRTGVVRTIGPKTKTIPNFQISIPRQFQFDLKFNIYHSLSVRPRAPRSMQQQKKTNQRISFFRKMFKMLAEVTSIYTVPLLLHKVNAQSRLYCGHGYERCSPWHRH